MTTIPPAAAMPTLTIPIAPSFGDLFPPDVAVVAGRLGTEALRWVHALGGLEPDVLAPLALAALAVPALALAARARRRRRRAAPVADVVAAVRPSRAAA
jgi:hypothetical protein